MSNPTKYIAGNEGVLTSYIGDNLGVEVWYDFQPYEHMTREYPGCQEKVTVTAVWVNGEDILDILKDSVIDQLEMRCMENEAGE